MTLGILLLFQVSHNLLAIGDKAGCIVLHDMESHDKVSLIPAHKSDVLSLDVLAEWLISSGL